MDSDLPEDWSAAIERAAGRRRILVVGATDVGKTSFIRALAAASAEPLRLIDLDPGQKMLGAPGTASLGRLGALKRFIFLGSTSASNLRGIGIAAAALAGEGKGRFVVNTSGFVTGLGARLQAITAKAVAPDLVVEIGDQPVLEGALRLSPSPLARRKSASARAAIRQEAFAAALAGAEPVAVDGVDFQPRAPVLAPRGPWPVCALADAEGVDMCIAVATGAGEVFAPPPPRPVRAVRLGKMWAEPRAGTWRLLDKLSPSWAA